MEKAVFISNNDITLEAILSESNRKEAAVICHPHPEFGGTMYNNVVKAIHAALFNYGYTTLRFNFRGVGKSTGRYDKGEGEKKDVEACISFLERLSYKPFLIAGYSFGAYIGSDVAVKDDRINTIILVAPPVNMNDFGFLLTSDKPKLFIAGDNDFVCSIDLLSGIINSTPGKKEFHIIKGSDHFFLGYEDEIRKRINDFLLRMNL